ncbi:MAG: Rrf2 family transcriptional regulator [Phaeodactylibacter sp.]|nr:Rrf2 family transcriptional regulator [Phaeodactylibacter sp.]MCB9263597.1 Rrf2 family transcriptional regulator [Lewinellaceae bacterium]MCB9287523.1 Rrf2 family transcriptional regulator [Lewinellaceae bacterium]
MKVLSKGCIYGLRALLYIVSEKPAGEYVNIREISEELDISFHYLTKTFQTLTHKGILRSYRGPNGGVALARPPEEFSLADIVLTLEGEDFFNKCLLGLAGCGQAAPCPVHDFWIGHKAELRTEFERTSLADMGKRINREKLRLGPV